jgi:hypothetical protein
VPDPAARPLSKYVGAGEPEIADVIAAAYPQAVERIARATRLAAGLAAHPATSTAHGSTPPRWPDRDSASSWR